MTIGIIPAVLLVVLVFSAFGLLEAWRHWLDSQEQPK